VRNPTPEQIRSWVFKNFPDHKLSKHGEEIRINNPLYADDGYHMWISVLKSITVDHRPQCKSGSSGSFLWFVKNYRKISLRDAAIEVMGEEAAGHVNHDRAYSSKKPRQTIKVDLPPGFKKFSESADAISDAVLNYLRSRSITDEQIMSLDIGYTNGFEAVFPYFENGDIVYWQSRSILQKQFNFPADSNKSIYIYGYDTIDPTRPVIVTESIINSLMFDNGSATGGSTIDEIQKRKFVRRGVKKMILAYDNDKAGKVGIAKSYKLMKDKFELYYSLTDTEDDDWNNVANKFGLIVARQMLERNLKKLDLRESIRLRM
jgi:hypothetical protein